MLTQKQADLAKLMRDRRRRLLDRVIAGDVIRSELSSEGHTAAAECVARSVLVLGTEYLKAQGYEVNVYDALERAYITLAQNDLHSYLIALEWHRDVKNRFYQPRMKVLKPWADAITDMMVHDRYDIVMLSSPPRVGKTTLGLMAISWLAGRNPSSPILAAGYAEKITKMFHTGIKELYENSEYAYRDIFPTLELVNVSADDLTLDFRNDGKSHTRKFKSVTCRAIDGSLHGATEARQLLYCDDLVRDVEEAMNPNRLAMLRTKLVSNLYSRKKENCKELHIGTRWSVHDPLGWVERMNEDNPRCKVIRIPALDPVTDESNFDYPGGAEGFSTAHYRKLREQEDEVTWKCVYQQQPVEREGLLFPSDELKYIYSLPDISEHPPDDIFAFCDVAFGGDDYLSLPIAYQWGDDPPVIADWVFLKGDYKVTEPVVAGHIITNNVLRAMFEANNGGDFYSRDIAKALEEQGHKLYLAAQRAPSNKSKEVRIQAHSPAIKGFSFLHPSVAPPMYKQALQQLTAYTMSGKNLHDDAPDSLAGLASMLRTNLNASVKIFDRQYI